MLKAEHIYFQESDEARKSNTRINVQKIEINSEIFIWKVFVDVWNNKERKFIKLFQIEDFNSESKAFECARDWFIKNRIAQKNANNKHFFEKHPEYKESICFWIDSIVTNDFQAASSYVLIYDENEIK